MAKSKRKWIQLDWEKSGALRAQDIPYDSTSSIKTKIDEVYSSSNDGYKGTISSFTASGDLYYADVSHNLNRRPSIICCYDSTAWTQLIPADVELTSVNVTRVWFDDDPISIEIVVISDVHKNLGYKTTLSSFTQDGKYYYADITHNLNDRPLVINCFESSSWLQVVPAEVKLTSVNESRLWFADSTTNIDVVVVPK